MEKGKRFGSLRELINAMITYSYQCGKNGESKPALVAGIEEDLEVGPNTAGVVVYWRDGHADKVSILSQF